MVIVHHPGAEGDIMMEGIDEESRLQRLLEVLEHYQQ